MRPFIALLCLFAPIGCGGSDQNADLNVPASTVHKTISPISVPSDTQKDIDAANARLGQTVALARVHLKHEEYEQAEKLLQQALADPIPTDKNAAIALLDETKSAKRRTQGKNDQRQPAPIQAPPGPAEEDGAGPPGTDRPKQPSTAASEAVDAPVPSQAANDRPHQPAAKLPTLDQAISELERKARRTDRAKDDLALYDEFIERTELTEKQAERVNSRRMVWKERANRSLVRLGSKWVTAKDAKAAAKEADTLISQAWELVKVLNFREARKLFQRASAVDRNGIRADFTLGLLNSLPYTRFNSPIRATKHFRTVLARAPGHIAALNNLALAEVKLRKFPSALNHWRQAVELTPKTPEVTQNIGRVISEASIGKLPASQTELAKFSRLYSETIVSGKGHPSDPLTGWLYMPLILPKAEKKREQDSNRKSGTGRLTAAGFGTGFVIHENFILTNRHVVDHKQYGIADAIRIVDPADPKHQRELEAKVVALSDELDLAILKCEKLEASVVPLSVEMPQRASEVLVLGYPRSTMIGRNLKTTKGIVTALPNPAHENMLLFDVEANHGNSGGPVVNNRGNVIAVLTSGYIFKKGAGKYTAGIPAEYAIPFIKQKLPKFDAKTLRVPRWNGLMSTKRSANQPSC